MIQTSKSGHSSAFSKWLRTGWLPQSAHSDGIELKFNPWHDPLDGRFTLAGSGHNYGAGGAESANRASARSPGTLGHDRSRKPSVATTPKMEGPLAEQPARHSKIPGNREAIEVQPKATESRLSDRPNPVTEFVGGVGEGLYNVAEGTVTGIYSALTTNPVTTVRNVGRGIADKIDAAIAAEETPARVQVARVAEAVGNASAREIGRAAGSVVGNAALAVAPEAAVAKVSALRRAGAARPRTTYDPPQIGWAKENLKSDAAWKKYNDSATGSRAGQAPTLMRTMPDGSKRLVKFDGVEGDFVIDRKWSVSGKPRSVAQILRQSEVLEQHRLIGTWELPTQAKRDVAVKLLKKLNVTNIKIRVVEP